MLHEALASVTGSLLLCSSVADTGLFVRPICYQKCSMEKKVDHLPHEYLRIAWYFLARARSITVEVTGRRRRKQVCWGTEILCSMMFSCHFPGNWR